MLKTTIQAAEELGIAPNALQQAVWARRLPRPKMFGRSFAWGDREMEAARELFSARRNRAKGREVNHE